MVSMPSDSGTTSSRSTTSPTAPPDSRSACDAAPSATTCSGSSWPSGSLPNSSATNSLDHRRLGRAAHQDDAVEVLAADLGVAQGPPDRARGLVQPRPHDLAQALAGERHGRVAEPHLAVLDLAQPVLGGAGLLERSPHQRRIALPAARAHRLQQPPGQGPVDVVAAQRGVAAGRQHLEHAAGELEDGDVEGAAAQVVDRVAALGPLVEAVGQRRRGGLGQKPQHLEPGQPTGVAGGLALGLVEVGRHRDDRGLDRACRARRRPGPRAPAGSRPTPRPG